MTTCQVCTQIWSVVDLHHHTWLYPQCLPPRQERPLLNLKELGFTTACQVCTQPWRELGLHHHTWLHPQYLPPHPGRDTGESKATRNSSIHLPGLHFSDIKSPILTELVSPQPAPRSLDEGSSHSSNQSSAESLEFSDY